MTRAELATLVREELLDDISDAQAGTDFTVQAVSDERLARWLLEGEREACRRRGTLIVDEDAAGCTLTLVAGVRSYLLDGRILRLLGCTYGTVTLTHTTEVALDRDAAGWRVADAGAPTACYIQNHRLYLDRTPSATEEGGNLRLRVGREPLGNASLETSPEIPASHHTALANWAAYRYFLMPDPHLRDDARALFFLQQFEQAFGPARSAASLEFRLEDPGWSDLGNGGYRDHWHSSGTTELTSF